MKAIEFQKGLYDIFKKHFPEGYAGISRLSLGSGLGATFGLQGKIDIRMNDPLQIRLFVHDGLVFNDASTDIGEIEMVSDASHVSVLPDNPMYYCKSLKIPYRKIKGTPEKVLVAFEKYIVRVRAVLDETIRDNMIIGQERIDPKYLAVK